jgi:hypothetical protein
VSRTWPSWLQDSRWVPAQKRLESRLHEMVVVAQSPAESSLAHDREGNAVSQGPFHVRPLGVELQARFKERGRGGNVLCRRAKTSKQGVDARTVHGSGTGIDRFPENVLGDEQSSVMLPAQARARA